MFPNKLSDFDHLRDNKMIAFKTENVGNRDVVIVSYMIGNKELWDDPIARECRGITFDAKTGECICAPFEKFFNVGEREETQEHVLPWDKISAVYEKRDGSMLTPVLIDDVLYWKTKKSFYSDVALKAANCVDTGLEIQARWYLDHGITPIYEFTHPDHAIVLDYGQYGQFKLLALRSMETGKYIAKADFGVQQYTKTVGDIKADVETLKEFEGYVVLFENGTRVKWKTKWYLEMHHVVTEVRERDIADAVIEETVDDVKSLAASKGMDLSKIELIEDVVVSQLADIESKVYALFELVKVQPTRKDAALLYRANEYFGLAMHMLDGKEPDFKNLWKKKYRDTFKLRTVFSNFSNRDDA